MSSKRTVLRRVEDAELLERARRVCSWDRAHKEYGRDWPASVALRIQREVYELFREIEWAMPRSEDGRQHERYFDRATGTYYEKPEEEPGSSIIYVLTGDLYVEAAEAIIRDEARKASPGGFSFDEHFGIEEALSAVYVKVAELVGHDPARDGQLFVDYISGVVTFEEEP